MWLIRFTKSLEFDIKTGFYNVNVKIWTICLAREDHIFPILLGEVKVVWLEKIAYFP